VRTLGQAPAERALGRYEELFRQLGGVLDAFTTNSHYSLSRLDVVEALVLALVGEDFRLDPVARRWLDEDEYRVRRRIHRDVREALSRASAGGVTHVPLGFAPGQATRLVRAELLHHTRFAAPG
jgi:hypothetical protein